MLFKKAQMQSQTVCLLRKHPMVGTEMLELEFIPDNEGISVESTMLRAGRRGIHAQREHVNAFTPRSHFNA